MLQKFNLRYIQENNQLYTRQTSYLIEQPCAKDYLEEIICYQSIFKLEWFAILHYPGPDNL